MSVERSRVQYWKLRISKINYEMQIKKLHKFIIKIIQICKNGQMLLIISSQNFLFVVINDIYGHEKFYFFAWRWNYKEKQKSTLCICSSVMKFDFIALYSLMTTFLCVHKETSVFRFIKSRHTKTVFKYLQFQYLSNIKAKNKRASEKKNERIIVGFSISHFSRRTFNCSLMKCTERSTRQAMVRMIKSKFILKYVIAHCHYVYVKRQ